MKHTQLIEKFKQILKKHFKEDEYFFYVLPNPHGASIRPYDCQLLVSGFYFAFEMKTGKDVVKKHQRYYLDKVKACGGIAIVVTDKMDLDLVIEVIKGSISPSSFSKTVMNNQGMSFLPGGRRITKRR